MVAQWLLLTLFIAFVHTILRLKTISQLSAKTLQSRTSVLIEKRSIAWWRLARKAFICGVWRLVHSFGHSLGLFTTTTSFRLRLVECPVILLHLDPKVISIDGSALMMVSDETIVIWNRKGERPIHHITGHVGTVNAVSWNPVYHSMLASGGDDGTVRIWLPENGGRMSSRNHSISAWFGRMHVIGISKCT